MSSLQTHVDLSGAAAIDLSGTTGATVATVPSPDPAPSPSPPVVEPTAPPAQTPVVAPAATLTTELSGAVDEIVHDLSGVGVTGITVGDLLRFVPRMASLVHALQIRGSEKRDMVIAAAHVLVDRVIGEGDRAVAHVLVDVVFPPAIAAVIDVVAGRVSFQQAVAVAENHVVVTQSGNCLSQILSCLAKK
jgi:hypothetical protein